MALTIMAAPAAAQTPVGTCAGGYWSGYGYYCGAETTVAGHQLSADCRDGTPGQIPPSTYRETDGCNVTAGPATADANRCDRDVTWSPGSSHTLSHCRTGAAGLGVHCESDEYIPYGGSTETCVTALGPLDSVVTVVCDSDSGFGRGGTSSHSESGCTASTPATGHSVSRRCFERAGYDEEYHWVETDGCPTVVAGPDGELLRCDSDKPDVGDPASLQPAVEPPRPPVCTVP
jgi:hypothetical protein